MKAQVYLAFAAALCWLAARTDAFAGTLPGAVVCARRGAASTAMAGQPSTAPPLSRRSACAVILCGAVAWRLGGAAPAVAASTAPEELAKLEHDALIQLAPEVQGEQRLAAWRKEKEEIKEALAREAAGQRPLPRVVEGADKAFKPPVVTAKSSAEALEIGAHLKEIGAVMYGGYGCMHCFRQKQLLGSEVVSSLLTYVECGKNGANSRRELCKEKGVKGFPTWEINGKMYPGEKSLADLAKLSNFTPANSK